MRLVSVHFALFVLFASALDILDKSVTAQVTCQFVQKIHCCVPDALAVLKYMLDHWRCMGFLRCLVLKWLSVVMSNDVVVLLRINHLLKNKIWCLCGGRKIESIKNSKYYQYFFQVSNQAYIQYRSNKVFFTWIYWIITLMDIFIESMF